MRQFKAGTKVKQGSYYAFIPNPINRRLDFADPELSVLLSKADQAIGRLDAFADYVNTDLYISMHITKEAVESNRIEGTKTEFTEAFLTADSIEKGRQDDWEEVNNYIKAVHHATARLKNFPLSTRLIREAHGILLAGVRGQHKQPGSFRTSQNWIGGASIADATFIPPPAHALGSLLSDLEFFINSDEHPIPALLKAAILHYQFETIHPFLDGNGRVGRLLIILYLIDAGVLKGPVLYLSSFFERNRRLYYDNLACVHEKDDLLQWLRFFLVGVTETALDGVRTFDGIIKLQRKTDTQLLSLGNRAADARTIIDALYRKPVITTQEAMELNGKSNASTSRLLNQLSTMGILREKDVRGRQRVFEYWEYVELFGGKH